MMNRLKTLFGGISAAALFGMMVLTFADVVSRKFLTNSITGAVEVTELMMLVMIFMALPLASLAGEHIVFDLLDRVLPAGLLRWQQALSNGLTGAVFGAVAWLVWERSQRTFEYGDTTSALQIGIWPYQVVAAVMMAVTALVHLRLAWRALDAAATATDEASAR